MIDTVYVEKEIQKYPRSQKIISKIKPKKVVLINKYTEIFNRKNQSYLLQKSKPSLILAKKFGDFFYKIKTNDSIGCDNNYYFSCVYNCPFSCKYCFLQGIFRSANYVIFVNYEDFQNQIEEKIKNTNEKICFFAGYDSDSLATEYFSGFIDDFYPFFEKHNNTFFEIRTKSANVSSLLDKIPLDNLVIAFSLNPDIVIKKIELNTPFLNNRLEAIKKLLKLGFKVGLRFDPVIYFENFQIEYKKFFDEIFVCLKDQKIHSITLGSLRYPVEYFYNIKDKNMSEELLASIKGKSKNKVVYDNENEILNFCKNELLKFNFKIFIHNT